MVDSEVIYRSLIGFSAFGAFLLGISDGAVKDLEKRLAEDNREKRIAALYGDDVGVEVVDGFPRATQDQLDSAKYMQKISKGMIIGGIVGFGLYGLYETGVMNYFLP